MVVGNTIPLAAALLVACLPWNSRAFSVASVGCVGGNRWRPQHAFGPRQLSQTRALHLFGSRKNQDRNDEAGIIDALNVVEGDNSQQDEDGGNLSLSNDRSTSTSKTTTTPRQINNKFLENSLLFGILAVGILGDLLWKGLWFGLKLDVALDDTIANAALFSSIPTSIIDTIRWFVSASLVVDIAGIALFVGLFGWTIWDSKLRQR